ncbi:MAG: hypothetical protein ABI861_13395 [Panacibacter sp.]
MKRIYVSFFTTVTVAIVMTLIAYLTRDDMSRVASMDKNTQLTVKDSTFLDITHAAKTFN